MDYEKRMKRQSFRVIVSEAIMVLTVVMMVAVLALVVSGYWLNSDFKVERQGMLQINSLPTGAIVAVDGDAPWYQRTNTSKVLASGEHHIVLTRDGYDSWEKTINISEGLLYRLHYPRLFLTERKRSVVYAPKATTYATASKNNNTMLLANNTTNWAVLKLGSDELDPKLIDIAPYFTSVSLAEGASAGLFTGAIVSSQWSGDNNHVLLETALEGSTEWVLLDLGDIKNSVNLTRLFATTLGDRLESVRIFDNSASNLLAIVSGNLYRLDVTAHKVSAAIAEDVKFYDFYGQDIVFMNTEYLGVTHVGDPEPTVIFPVASHAAEPSVTDDEPDATAPIIGTNTRAYFSRFYDQKYLTIITDDVLTIYERGGDYNEATSLSIGFVPDEVKVSDSGDYVFMRTGTSAATYDMEAEKMTSWTLDSPHYGWLDTHMLYTVADGNLSVYDYDGLNRRTLASGASSHFPVIITQNKWLYYLSNDEIIREIIAR